jgi:hypothetical protein
MASYDTAPTFARPTGDTGWVSSTDLTPRPDSAWKYVSIPSPSGATSERYETTTRLEQNVTGASVMPGLGPPVGGSTVALPEPAKPLSPTTSQHVTVVGRWEGVVTEKLADLFVASITPIDSTQAAFVAEIAVSRVGDDDQPLIQEGAPFYLILSDIDAGAGRRSQISTVRFRRLPTWTRTDEVGWLKRGDRRRSRAGVYGEEEDE